MAPFQQSLAVPLLPTAVIGRVEPGIQYSSYSGDSLTLASTVLPRTFPFCLCELVPETRAIHFLLPLLAYSTFPLTPLLLGSYPSLQDSLIQLTLQSLA